MKKHEGRALVPTIITIFGGTGDLARKKLFPALFDLYLADLLPERFKVVGFARTAHSNDEYRSIVGGILGKRGEVNQGKLAQFLSTLEYHAGVFDDPSAHLGLAGHLHNIEDEFGQCPNKLFYLAVPPMYYEHIFKNLADSKLTAPCSDETGWTRVLVEKPFGKDIHTAQELDRLLGELFKEEQIFRIDHYLAKEVLQDMLMFRFSNLIFEPIWNNKYIERVVIRMTSSGNLVGRGAFYDGIGALRDVGQNHMLQMLATVATEDPRRLDAKHIRSARADVLAALRSITKESLAKTVVRAQYDGYRGTEHVAPKSSTETYFKMKVFIDNNRWQDVPFYLESGQGMSETSTEIKIHFKKATSSLCPPGEMCDYENILTFKIQPNEGISIRFWTKKPGIANNLEPKELAFSYRTSKDDRLTDAYEKVLFDGIAGDQTLFASTDEVFAAWNFVTPILDQWSDLPLLPYSEGSDGPETEIFD